MLRSNTIASLLCNVGRTIRKKIPGESSICCYSADAYTPSYEKSVPDGLPGDFIPWQLQESYGHTHDTKILRFNLPENIPNLEAIGAPSGVKIRKFVNGKLLDKSMSPISHPSAAGYVDLLVRSYGHPPESEGLGSFLCGMLPGQTVDVKLKPRRLFHGSAWAGWQQVGLICCGTGVAPCFQFAHAILRSDPTVNVRMISAHRTNKDILLREEINLLESDYGHRFQNTFIISSTSGHISCNDLSEEIFVSPSADKSCHVVVCGTDSFLETVCGGFVRSEVPGQKKKRKLQGPLRGLLRKANFSSSQVTRL